MKPRWQVGWILFALFMVWGECIGDVPRLLLPHRTTPIHLVAALANATAVLGLTFYAFGWISSRPFWRLYAPLYAMLIAAQLGSGLVVFTRAVVALLGLGRDAPLMLAGAFVVVLPITAMAVFTLVALFRLGDWIGATRRPVGLRPQQLSLAI